MVGVGVGAGASPEDDVPPGSISVVPNKRCPASRLTPPTFSDIRYQDVSTNTSACVYCILALHGAESSSASRVVIAISPSKRLSAEFQVRVARHVTCHFKKGEEEEKRAA
jgi:hypothetical protein